MWLLLGGAQQLLNENSQVCYASWHKAYSLEPDSCVDAKFLLGAAEYNRGNWAESRKALEACVTTLCDDNLFSSYKLVVDSDLQAVFVYFPPFCYGVVHF